MHKQLASFLIFFFLVLSSFSQENDTVIYYSDCLVRSDNYDSDLSKLTFDTICTVNYIHEINNGEQYIISLYEEEGVKRLEFIKTKTKHEGTKDEYYIYSCAGSEYIISSNLKNEKRNRLAIMYIRNSIDDENFYLFLFNTIKVK